MVVEIEELVGCDFQGPYKKHYHGLSDCTFKVAEAALDICNTQPWVLTFPLARATCAH